MTGVVIPALATVYAPMLLTAIHAIWPAMPAPAMLAAQIEQETCYSLTHPKCWNPRAELKTTREYGFGLGQLTVTPAFNNFVEAKKWDKSLANWQWEDRFNPDLQLKALVAYDHNLFLQIRFGATVQDKLAFMFSSYNGGLGGLLKDRRMCAAIAGCDPEVWFGHVEQNSFRAKTAVSGYGKSFFAINREYVVNVMRVRREKYRTIMHDKG